MMDQYELVSQALQSFAEGIFMSVSPKLQPVVVEAAFDENGKLADSDCVSFAGCVRVLSPDDVFSRKWQERLQREGLGFTSMKDAVHFRGQYEGWGLDEGRRDALLIDLAMLMIDHVLIVGSSMLTSEFRVLPQEEQKALGGDVVYAQFEACIKRILTQPATLAPLIVCDLAEEYSEKLLRLFHKLRRMCPLAKARCLGITFADDKAHVGVQAADMVAYCRRADKLQRSYKPPQVVDKLVEIFQARGRSESYLVYRDGKIILGQGELGDAV